MKTIQPRQAARFSRVETAWQRLNWRTGDESTPIPRDSLLAITVRIGYPWHSHATTQIKPMTTPTILLVDNGSSRAEAALNLRRLASDLSTRSGLQVHPVSLQHADQIAADQLEGIPAQTFSAFLETRLSRGERDFLALPLFFGPSRALSRFIPEQVARFETVYGPISFRQAPILCPLPEGEPRLASLLREQVITASGDQTPRRVILVDHGSPIPSVTAVRRYLADEMRRQFGPETDLQEAVMERREGPEYDFNGELLESLLTRLAQADDTTPITLSLLFMSPGRHAGAGGDIETICERVRHIIFKQQG